MKSIIVALGLLLAAPAAFADSMLLDVILATSNFTIPTVHVASNCLFSFEGREEGSQDPFKTITLDKEEVRYTQEASIKIIKPSMQKPLESVKTGSVVISRSGNFETLLSESQVKEKISSCSHQKMQTSPRASK